MDKQNRIKIDWGALTEISALYILGLIAIVAMGCLGIGGKEIALSIGSGIGGYLVKGTIDKKSDRGNNDAG